MMEQTPLLVSINIILFLILYTYVKPAYVSGYLTKDRRKKTLFLVYLFCLFSFWGKDWFGYQGYFEEIQKGNQVSSMEDIYNWIGAYICPNYIFFRFYIWGMALFLFFRTVRLLKLDYDLSLFFFCSIYLIWFSYARVSLAMAVMFYGFANFVTYKGNKKKLLGLILILLAYYLHKSAIFGIAIIILVGLMKRMGKYAIVIPIVMFPILLFFVSSNIGGFMDSLLTDEDNMLNEYATAGNSYLMSDSNLSGPGVLLQGFLERAPYYLLAFCSIPIYFKKKIMVLNNIKPFFLILLLIVVFSSVFAFDLGMNTSTLYGRFLRFSQIPACIVLTFMYSNRILPKLTKIVINVSIISTFYSLIYVLYNSYVAQS